ncbi:putative cytochrome c mitochondrial import factor CYC2 [Triangularia verruculosa]|uniref:Cytochrome c mitochondrial import factor CYC2 n=1 Tax=Triangularia verruculosa TaxID=2587418 RepID=A0AAN6XLC2_9PEZI|nr:putative cytochrome c mitochondrial import factor CYC2 [Triangularia verruculosa]
MSGRLLAAGFRLPRQAAAEGRIDLAKFTSVPRSSHSQRYALQRIYTQNHPARLFHASISRQSRSRFGPSKSREQDLKAADGQEELRPSRKEKRRERERRVQERLNLTEDGKERSQKERSQKERSQKQDQSQNGAKQEKTRRVPFKVVLAVGAGFVLWQTWKGVFAAEPLNGQTFSPFEIVDQQQISPTAFIITVKPVISRWDPLSGQAKLEWIDNLQRELSRAGTWAVEIKQPELQVARDYTPLPYDEPSTAHEDGTQDRARSFFFSQPTSPTMKFLIRKTDGGEVSSWLSRRKVGDTIELRGPHQSFNVVARVGAEDGDKRVVFLAGGTGIAPALQTANSIFQEHQQTMKQMPQVDIIWANRSREDCRPENPIIKLLEQLKQESQGKISYVCTVDEDGTFITANDIIAKAQLESPKQAQKPTASPRKSWWFSASAGSTQANAAQLEPPTQSTGKDETNCYFHSPQLLVASAGEDYEKINGEKRNPKWKCTCWKKVDGVDLRIPKFKNLLMVSGPEGFINHFAGPKYWADGKERQGPVGGVIGQLAKKYPSLTSDWLVLKL